jgi:hypothetical protein
MAMQFGDYFSILQNRGYAYEKGTRSQLPTQDPNNRIVILYIWIAFLGGVFLK